MEIMLFLADEARGSLTVNSILQSGVWKMISQRAIASQIETVKIGCTTFLQKTYNWEIS